MPAITSVKVSFLRSPFRFAGLTFQFDDSKRITTQATDNRCRFQGFRALLLFLVRLRRLEMDDAAWDAGPELLTAADGPHLKRLLGAKYKEGGEAWVRATCRDLNFASRSSAGLGAKLVPAVLPPAVVKISWAEDDQPLEVAELRRMEALILGNSDDEVPIPATPQVPSTRDGSDPETARNREDRPGKVAPDRTADPVGKELPERNPRFAGRLRDLRAIHALLSRETDVGVIQQAGLHAQGGAGKTSVALEYAWRCVDPKHPWCGTYPGGIFFVPCDVADIRPYFASLARRLGVREVFSDDEALRQLKAVLGAPALFVLDNVHNGEQWTSPAFRQSLPGHPCKHLITTRAEQLPGVEPHQLPGLTRADGIKLLAKYRPDAAHEENRQVVGDIVDWFNGLAVGLAVSGVFMALHPGTSWAAFASLLNRHGLGYVRLVERELAERQGGRVLPDYPKRVDAVFDETLASLGPAERLVLEYASLLPEDDVPGAWLLALLRNHITLEDTELAAQAAQSTLDRLLGLRLLHEVDEQRGCLGLHRVLRSRLQERLKADPDRRRQHLRLLTDLILKFAVQAQEHFVPSGLPGLQTALRTLPLLAEEGDPVRALNVAVLLWYTLGEQPGHSQQLQAAFSCLQRHYPRFEAGDPQVRKLFRLHLLHLGHLAYRHCRTSEMLESYERATALARADHASEVELATCLANVALACSEAGRPVEALRVHREVIRMERRNPERKAHLCRTLSNAAMCYHALRKYRWAEFFSRCALAQGRAAGEVADWELTQCQGNLAAALQAQGRYTEAVAIQERLLAVDRQHRGEKDPAIAATLQNLGFCYQQMGRIKEAEECYQQAIDVVVAAYGYDDPRCLPLYTNVMVLFREIGKPDAARNAADAAVRILTAMKQRGDSTPHTITVYLNAAEVFYALSNFKRAKALIDLAIASALELEGEASPELPRCYCTQAGICQGLKDWGAAATAWQAAIKCERKQSKPRASILGKWEEFLSIARRKAAKQSGNS